MEGVRGNSYFSSCDHVDADARLFCRTCKKLICDDCIISREHADHVLDKLQSAEEWIEKELETKLGDVRDTVPSIESKIKECKDKKAVVEQRMSSMVDLVNTNYETSVNMLKGEKDNLLKELTTLKEANVGEYEGKEHRMAEALSRIRQFEITAEHYIQDKESGRLTKIKEIPNLPEMHFDVPNVALPFLLSEMLPKETSKEICWHFENGFTG
ncbi:hypothetical protein FSP39_023539 [Pinctada imbricata]|uniref:B box-type domain-containing protein n=1 Tax=Pinctada imbricata TaxID=66713 RepID=A0AA89C2U6_PINIB|nr:hypothetical protein FSP39_023539 [Pinctada imbricata]